MRIDSGVVEGDTVTIFYDPMIAKLIAWDATRELALVRMREALACCDIVGPKSNIEFLENLVRHPAVVAGRIDTGYLDRHLDEFLRAPQSGAPAAADMRALLAAATAWLLHEEHAAVEAARTSAIRIRRGRVSTAGGSAIPASASSRSSNRDSRRETAAVRRCGRLLR